MPVANTSVRKEVTSTETPSRTMLFDYLDFESTCRNVRLTRWLRMRQNLLQRVPMDVVFRTRCSLADFAAQDAAADLRPFLHIRKHPSTSLLPCLSGSENQPFCKG